MLETPLEGRFVGENRKLIFAPPLIYDYLVYGCLAAGALGVVEMFLSRLGVEMPLIQLGWLAPFFVLVGLAGLWALLSLQRIVFDLRERTYVRRDGPGVIKSTRRGRIDDLEALTLLAENAPLLSVVGGQSQAVVYRLVAHWRGMAQPIMVLQVDTRYLSPGMPLNGGAGPILQLGVRYAHALQLPLFDQSHVSTPCPVPFL